MRRPLWLAAAVLLLALGWWAYAPGLHGGFLFDDFNNLDQLGAYGPVDNFRTLALYLTSGSADPIGRPLSLLSFLIDARNWPADPEPFKRTSILLHLLNGALLAVLLGRLGRRLGIAEAQNRAAAVLGAGLWTLHPLLVSTTLYIVQREAMLPASFSLLGMLLWIEGGDRIAAGRGWGRSYLLAAAWGCTALATLCKANGLLLPLLLASLEWAIPAGSTMNAPAASLRRTRTVILGLPGLPVIAWLLSKIPAVFSGETYGRPWTIGQRLLSEGRVVCDYLRQLWIPHASGTSVFNDGFPASADWLHPWSTLPAVAVLAALLTLGIRQRRRCPPLAFAIVFFFTGQLLESTFVPLELYFEHRNYLPAMPMFWPLALWLLAPGRWHKLRLGFSLLLLGILAVLCHARAGIWGHPYEQALLLAKVDPDSARAQANAAAYEMANGRPDLASARLAAASRERPNETQLALNWVAADCQSGAASTAALEAAQHALAHSREDTVLVQNWLNQGIDTAAQGRCKGLDLPEVERMIQAMSDNPGYPQEGAHLTELQRLRGRLALARGDGALALRDFNAALTAFPTADNALLQAAMLGSAGFSGLGVEHLHFFRTLTPVNRSGLSMPSLHFWLLEHDGYWSGELARVERQLQEEAAGAQGAGSKGS